MAHNTGHDTEREWIQCEHCLQVVEAFIPGCCTGNQTIYAPHECVENTYLHLKDEQDSGSQISLFAA